MGNRVNLALSLTALLVAVFGATPVGEAAYNALVPRNSVGAAQLRNGAVTNVKLRGDAVTSGKVKNRSLKAIDFKAGQLPAGPAGPAGPQGGKGPKGDKGDKGASGIATITKRESALGPGTTLGDGTQVLTEACNAGETLLSGGPANIAATTTLLESFPAPGGTNSWQTRVNKNGQADNFSVVVLCAGP